MSRRNPIRGTKGNRSSKTIDPYRDRPDRTSRDGGGFFSGAVSIGSFEVSRWRDGRGDRPIGFQTVLRIFAKVVQEGGKMDRAQSSPHIGRTHL
jgi:hypothetical protein